MLFERTLKATYESASRSVATPGGNAIWERFRDGVGIIVEAIPVLRFEPQDAASDARLLVFIATQQNPLGLEGVEGGGCCYGQSCF